ncbi:MAG: ATP-binding cassette domain-containing protein [Deltaproteobacteria bacterium]|nr:ATP-binding cassette domain-containing protein [Deltaproteobacteria bacterium]
MTVTARIKELSLSYGESVVFEKISFSLRKGELTFLNGPSGAGKTSLLQAFNRTLPAPPACLTGGVEFFLSERWVSSHSLPLPLLRTKVALILQTPQLLPGSIRRNVELPLKVVGKIGKSERNERIEVSLKRTGLWETVKDKLNQPASILSGGQKQRLCLARAIAMKPAFLLLDEPTAFLDQASAEQILVLLQELKDECTILVVSHKEKEAEVFADKKLFLLELQETCPQGISWRNQLRSFLQTTSLPKNLLATIQTTSLPLDR